jgi:hypothetical protein
MKLLILVGMMAVVMSLGLWQVFSSVHPGPESRMVQYHRAIQEVK